MGNLKFILISCLVLIATSCNGLFGVDNNVGKPVQFGIVQNPKTRTSYSSEYDGRIDWVNLDKVAIYMDWDETRKGYGYSSNYRENGIYEVYNIHENGRESHGSIRYVSGEILKWKGDFSGNNGRANEYPHRFWSVYPYNTPFSNGKFEFSLPSNQDNINDVSGLGLAAYEVGINSAKNPNNEGYVELHYYPMFTTFDVTVNNNSKKNITGELRLASKNQAISGTYYVSVQGSKFVFDSFDSNNNRFNYIDKTIGTLPDEGSVELMYFMVPINYGSDDLYFSFSFEEDGVIHPINNGVTGGKKYNIVINVNEKNVEVEEPVPVPPTGDDLDEVTAQIILCYLRVVLVNNGYNKFESFWKTYFDYTDKTSQPGGKTGSDYFNEGWYQQFQNKFNNASDWLGFIYELFGVPPAVKEGALNAMLKEIWESGITELSLNNGDSKLANGFTETTQLSKFFPNLQSLKLQIDGKKGYVIYLTDFDSLNVEIGGNNGDITIYIAKGSKINITNTGNNTINVVEIEVEKT